MNAWMQRAPQRAGLVRLLLGAGTLALGTALVGCSSSDDPPSPPPAEVNPPGPAPEPAPVTMQAELRRTSFGVPHVKATDWQGLGYGIGYAQASDDLCTIADAMLTYRGERSRHFGAAALPPFDSTIGRQPNLDSDFFHRHLLNDARIGELKGAQPEPVVQMVRGYAAGFSRYVRDLKAGAASGNAACSAEPWVGPLTEDDIWRRLQATTLAGGHANFLRMIANAVPPTAAATPTPTPAPAPAADAGTLPVLEMIADLGTSLDTSAIAEPEANDGPGLALAPYRLNLGRGTGIGSNMYGFGADATGAPSGVLFGNPHWYWKGPDRFYQQQLTLPGQIDAGGVSFLGLPFILIGFNNQVAWSHTVSTARRFGLYQYTLDPADPTRLMIDGSSTPLTAAEITVAVRQASGEVTEVSRTLYRSPHGPMINLGALDPALAWSPAMAFAIRDVNEANYRTYASWLGWARAGSLAEFIDIQRRYSAVPWVNTVAAGRDDPQVWYADIGNIPNVPDAVVQACTTAIGQAIAGALPGTPVLDGSKSDCDWRSDPDSVQPGSLGPARMPSLRRRDYVANMNDSYWLANPADPLTGFPAIIGSTTEPQSLRTRMGHTMARERLAGTDGYAGRFATPELIREMVLDSRNYSAETLRPQVLSDVCAGQAELAEACAILQAWDGRGHAGSRGAILWQAFWSQVELDDEDLYAVPFDTANPIDTPRGLKPEAVGPLRVALQRGIDTMNAAGLAWDVPKGDVLYSERGGVKMPLYGGCYAEGYFTITCSDQTLASGGQAMDGFGDGNSYLQVVNFNGPVVEAHTLLTHSLSDDPASAHFGDYTLAYSRKQWHRVPFTEAEIAADPAYRTTLLAQ